MLIFSTVHVSLFKLRGDLHSGPQDQPQIIRKSLIKLQPLWPRGLSIGSLFADIPDVRGDIEWLLRYQLIELRCIEPGDFETGPEPLHALEKSLRNSSTSAWHSINEHKEEC